MKVKPPFVWNCRQTYFIKVPLLFLQHFWECCYAILPLSSLVPQAKCSVSKSREVSIPILSLHQPCQHTWTSVAFILQAESGPCWHLVFQWCSHYYSDSSSLSLHPYRYNTCDWTYYLLHMLLFKLYHKFGQCFFFACLYGHLPFTCCLLALTFQ